MVGALAARERQEVEEDSCHSSTWWDWELEGPCWGFDGIGKLQSSCAWDRHTESILDEDSDEIQEVRSQAQRLALERGDCVDNKSTQSGSLASPTRNSGSQRTRSSARSRDRSISPANRPKLRQDDSSMTQQQPMFSPRLDFHALRSSTDPTPSEPLLDYGAISHRIGESCLCYISRWGPEIAEAEGNLWQHEEAKLSEWLDSLSGTASRGEEALVCGPLAGFLLPRGYLPGEVQLSTPSDSSTQAPSVLWDIPQPQLCIFSHPTYSHRTVPRDYVLDLQQTSREGDGDLSDDEGYAQRANPRLGHLSMLEKDIVNPGPSSSLGMVSSHLVDLLGSDAFFTRTELQRYKVARGIVQMRRSQRALMEDIFASIDNPDGPPEGEPVWIKTEQDVPFGLPSRGTDSTDRSTAALGSPARFDYSRVSSHGAMDVDLSINENTDDDVEELDPDDEYYLRLFREGIYYSHFNFDDLKAISREAEILAQDEEDALQDDNETDLEDQDSYENALEESFAPSFQSPRISQRPARRRWKNRVGATAAPVRGGARIFAPIETLQAALWAGNELKNNITSSNMGSSIPDAASALASGTAAVNPDSIRRGLAFAAEGSPLVSNEERAPGMTSSASQTSLSTGAATDEATLGISSSLKNFATALQQASASVAGGRRSLLRGVRKTKSSTPLGSGFSPSKTESNPPVSSLGGLAYSPLHAGGGGIGAAKNLLSKRYFSIPVDDTVRYGEFFAGLLNGNNWTASGGASTTTSPTANGHLITQHAHEATGLATMRNVYALPAVSSSTDKSSRVQKKALPYLENCQHLLNQLEAVLLGGPFADSKRTKANLFGLHNKHCKGRTLGRLGDEIARQKGVLDTVASDPDRPGEKPRSSAVTNAAATSNADLSSLQHDGRAVQDDEEQGVSHNTRSGGAATGLEDDGDLDGALVFARLERRRWTGFEPMRVGVEYYGLSVLEEKHRLYSPSFFYAGSVWNLYVQTMRKQKGIQLGVYLHRQSPYEPLPPASAHPDAVAAFLSSKEPSSGGNSNDKTSNVAALGRSVEAGAMTDRNGRALAPPAPPSADSLSFLHTSSEPPPTGASAAQRGRPATSPNAVPQPSPKSPHVVIDGPPVLPGVSPPIPYRDPRKIVRAYFSIHCYSPLGNSLTRFDSGPDKFSESQSWGWKSSSLMGIWELEGGRLAGGRSEGGDGFRCVVTLGVV